MKLEQKVKKDISDNKVTVAFTVDDDGQVEFMGVDSILDEVKELAKELANKLKEVHETRGDQQLKFSKYVIPTFPKLPLKLTSKDWDSDLARETLRSYMQLLGYKIKGKPEPHQRRMMMIMLMLLVFRIRREEPKGKSWW